MLETNFRNKVPKALSFFLVKNCVSKNLLALIQHFFNFIIYLFIRKIQILKYPHIINIPIRKNKLIKVNWLFIGSMTLAGKTGEIHFLNSEHCPKDSIDELFPLTPNLILRVRL